MRVPRLVVAGTESGAGKTTVALGLMRALRRRGLRVQSFKVGPDYIDPAYHTTAAGRPSRNLDGWMCGEDLVRALFARAAGAADVAVIGWVMGLFDSAGPATDSGSTAEVARWLDAPVILVVDASGMARIAAAMVRGYATFDPRVRIAGVVFNRVGRWPTRWRRRSTSAGCWPSPGTRPSTSTTKTGLAALGVEWAPFSLLAGESIPAGSDALYLGGGFPEVYRAEHAAHDRLRADVEAAHRSGMPIYAECGGLM
ncbi:nucleotide-binding protein [Caldinitratiruptor microaerophilus]|nr:AAA family ATPase [Caldinitratiruptor microaerophilus]